MLALPDHCCERMCWKLPSIPDMTDLLPWSCAGRGKTGEFQKGPVTCVKAHRGANAHSNNINKRFFRTLVRSCEYMRKCKREQPQQKFVSLLLQPILVWQYHANRCSYFHYIVGVLKYNGAIIVIRCHRPFFGINNFSLDA